MRELITEQCIFRPDRFLVRILAFFFALRKVRISFDSSETLIITYSGPVNGIIPPSLPFNCYQLSCK